MWRPTEYPSSASGFFGPQAVSFDEGIRDLDQLPHERDERDFRGLPGFAQLLVLDLEVRVETHGDESGHVERVAQWLAPTTDEGLALPLACLPVVRNQPGQAPGLLSPERADFREKGENGSGGNLPDAGDRAQDVALACA